MHTVARDGSLLHLKEAARILDCHPATLRRRIKTGELEAVRLGGRGRLRIRASALDELLRPATDSHPSKETTP